MNFIKKSTFVLVGNPNSGKTTLFNSLTGLRQKVGNYSGVTVEKKEGTCFSQHGAPINLIDLPGIYSLSVRSPDEAITRSVLLGHEISTEKPDGVLAIVDASNLERHLYLVLQLLELGLPTIIVLNMIDVAKGKGLSIDTEGLSALLGTPVVATKAIDSKSVLSLKLAMSRPLMPPRTRATPTVPGLAPALLRLAAYGIEKRALSPAQAQAESFLSLTAHPSCPLYPEDTSWNNLVEHYTRELSNQEPIWAENLISQRYAQVSSIYGRVVKKLPDAPQKSITEQIDRWVLHPIWGSLILVFILGFLFYSIFYVAEFPKVWIEDALNLAGEVLENNMPAGELRSLIAHGIVAGVGAVLAFLPQILLLFMGIGLLESSGYLSRAAFILDRPMQRVGLQGAAFIPFLSSYACAIPGIMATRTIASPADRLATILVAPWASCSARLPVYLVMVSVLSPWIANSPTIKALCLFCLYALGTFSAFAFAWVFRRTIVPGGSGPALIELPLYRLPIPRLIIWEMFTRARLFVVRAGTIILALSILIWYTLSHPVISNATSVEQLQQSYAGQLGILLEPFLKPLGFDWKIGIGLITSFAAREVFISTMAIIYGVVADSNNLHEVLQSEINAAGLPVFTPLVCLSLLVFYVYAMQCISTLAIVKRETNSWRWPLFQLGYMTAMAYITSLIVYQGGKWLGLN